MRGEWRWCGGEGGTCASRGHLGSHFQRRILLRWTGSSSRYVFRRKIGEPMPAFRVHLSCGCIDIRRMSCEMGHRHGDRHYSCFSGGGGGGGPKGYRRQWYFGFALKRVPPEDVFVLLFFVFFVESCGIVGHRFFFFPCRYFFLFIFIFLFSSPFWSVGYPAGSGGGKRGGGGPRGEKGR